MTRSVGLTEGTASWRRLRVAQRSRRSTSLDRLPGGPVPTSDAARRFWSQRTWSELAAVPAVAQVVLALVREGAGLSTLGAYTTIADDEVRHALLSRQLAERLGGYVDEVPAGLEYAPRSLAAPSQLPVAVWALANGCFSETVSLALIAARHAATRQRVVRAVLTETLKDEAVHVRVSWQLAEELLPGLPRETRRELREYGGELALMLRRTFGTSGLPPAVRRRERGLRDETHRRALGSLSADEEDAVVERALQGTWARLKRLGV